MRRAATTGRRALGVACHVGRWDDCDALVERVYGEFGRCDVLMNNAGIGQGGGPFENYQRWQRVLDVNLVGVFNGIQAVISPMRAAGGGSIVNISSAAAVVIAACGVVVAKHGNRAITSASGSADVLEALGIRIDLSPAEAAAALAEHGLVKNNDNRAYPVKLLGNGEISHALTVRVEQASAAAIAKIEAAGGRVELVGQE